MIRKFFAVLFVVSLLAFSVGAHADDMQQEGDSQPADLGEIRVVSNPIIEGNRVTDFAGQVTSVSNEQVDALDAVDLSGALRTAPGVNITRYNHIGSFGGGSGGAIFIRGIGASRPGGEIQTMIDGVPVYNGVWNHPLLDLLPVNEAGKIDVFKGSQPMMFGNGFGAVNIIPKRRLVEGYETDGKIGYGMFNTIEQNLGTEGKFGIFDYRVGQQFARSSGDRDDSGGRIFNVSATSGLEMTDHWQARVTGMFSDNLSDDPGRVGAPASKEGNFNTRGGMANLTILHEYDVIKGDYKFYWSGGKSDWLNQAGTADDTKSNWLLGGVKLNENITLWKGGTLLVGSDLDLIDGDCDFVDDTGARSRFNGPLFSIFSAKAGFSQMFGSREGFYVMPSGGLRYYTHSDFPSKIAPQGGFVLGYKNTEAHFSYSRGINYPGLNVVAFSQNVIPPLGNSWKDLKPETVDHIEAGISQKVGKWMAADLTFFHDRGRNRYIMVFTSPPPYFANVEKFTIYGVEGTVGITPVDFFSFFAGATYLHKDPSDLPYAPELTVSGGFGWSIWKGLHIDMDGQYVSTVHSGPRNRASGTTNPNTVGAFFLLNGKLRYNYFVKAIKSEISPYVAVENIANADYEYQPGYPMPGISAIGGVQFMF